MNTLRAGVARTEINPPVGVELCGYGPFLGRTSTGVHDSLWCRALVLERGGESLVIVGCDLIGAQQQMTDEVRRLVHERLGIPPERVMITCTHTHSGPATLDLIGWGAPDPLYLDILTHAIAATIDEAVKNLQPAQIAAGRTVLEGIGRNRVQSDGTGLIDPELTVLRVIDDGESALAVIFHYAAHPVVMGRENRLISGDWAGEAERWIEADSAGAKTAFFLNGACGDINSIVAVTSPPDWNAVAMLGSRMHQAVLALLPTLRNEETVSLAAHRRSVRLPLTQPDQALVAKVLNGYDHTPQQAGDQPYYVTGYASERFERAWAEAMQAWMARSDRDDEAIELQAFQIGPLALLAVPAEVFTALGLAIKQRSRFPLTAVVSFANNYVGYIPRRQDYDATTRGGRYAAFLAPQFVGLPPFASHVGDILVEDASALLADLSSSTLL